MNVTLVGMAGAGKSYIGQKLADRLTLDFIDIDDLLEAAYGKPIQALFEDMGEERYLDAEAEMLVNGTSGRSEILISPGGSIVYKNDMMQHVRDISKVVYLMVPFETIQERIKKVPQRPIIGLGRKTLREIYDERHPLYLSNADIVVDTAGRGEDEILTEIITSVRPS